MKNRPLLTVCLLLFLAIALPTLLGEDDIIDDLRDSPVQQLVEDGAKVTLTGRLYKQESKAEHQVLYLTDISISYQQRVLQESKIIVYDQTMKTVKLGNVIQVSGEVSLMEHARNPGNFDEKMFYQRQGIQAKIWAESVRVLKVSVDTFRNGLWEFQQKWKGVLFQILGQEKGAVMSGIMLGDKAQMDSGLKELYQMNGIGHILAISGLHLSFIGIGMYRLLRRISGSFVTGGCAGMAFLLCYILMIGPSVSAIRALIMFLFRVGADMAGRHYDAPTALGAAACIVMIWRPLYLFDGGFWLSFGAVAGALAVVPLFKGLPVQGFWASVGINIVIFPILLYYFYEFPLYSVFLNMLVIPLLSVLLFLGMAGSAVFFAFPYGGSLILKLGGLILNLYEWVCGWALDLPGARVVTGQPALWKIIIYYLLAAGAAVICRRYFISRSTDERIEKKTRRKRQTAVCWAGICIVAGAVLAVVSSPAKQGQLEITMLDVGQGDGIYVKAPSGQNYFFDGGSSDIKQVGRYRIEAFLKFKGVRSLDYVFISHGDSDHTSGIEEMLERKKTGVNIKNLVVPPQELWDEKLTALARQATAAKVRVLVMKEGQVLTDGKLRLICLHPGEACQEEPGNAASMVMGLEYGELDMLLTGDVEGKGETHVTEILKKYGNVQSWDILKVAHHGSKNSTSQEFLDLVQPVYGLISAGRDNRYGHPHKDTVEKLKESGCQLYTTQVCGAIVIETDGKAMQLSGYIHKDK